MQYVWRIRKSKELAQEEKMREYSNTEVEILINEYIHSERDRKILKRRLLDGIHYEPLAEEFDLSTKQVKNIIYRGEDKIFKYLR